MKVFKFKFTRLTSVFIYLGIAVCLIGLGLDIYSVITSDIASSANPVYPIIQHTLMFFIPIVLLVLLVSFLISSYYSVDEKYLKTSFGIIKSKYALTDIKTVLLDRTNDKLTVIFKNESFIVIVVKKEWYEEFIDLICAANPEIEYTIKSKESSGDDKDKKD